MPQDEDFDGTVAAMALTAKEMNVSSQESSEGGLAVSGGLG
jgi:L-serine deaminase